MHVEKVPIPTRVARAGMTVREVFEECSRANTPGLADMLARDDNLSADSEGIDVDCFLLIALSLASRTNAFICK